MFRGGGRASPAPTGSRSLTANGVFYVPAGVYLLTRLVVQAPGGRGGDGSLTIGVSQRGGGGGGGGEIVEVANVPVVPNMALTVTLDLTGTDGGGTVTVVHPTLGTLAVKQGDRGADASGSASGAGGKGGGTSGGAQPSALGSPGNGPAGNNGTTASDTSTWSGVTITRHGGGSGGTGCVDNTLGGAPDYTGGTGGTHAAGGAGNPGDLSEPIQEGGGGGGGGEQSLAGIGSVNATGGQGQGAGVGINPPGGYVGKFYVAW